MIYVECILGYFGIFCNLFCFVGLFGKRCGGKCFLNCIVEYCNYVIGCYYIIKIII